MQIGYIVGTMVAVLLIISGVVAAIIAKKNQKKVKWSAWTVILGVAALISAVINYKIFN